MRQTIAALGPVMQLAYLPDDFDAALADWTQRIGAGPFFMLPNITLPDMYYLGQPTSASFSLALGYWGEMQIELIRAEDDAPSVYTGNYAVRDRLHHVCVLVDDIGEAREVCDTLAATIVLEARVGEHGGGVLYVDTGGGPGTLIELLQPEPGTIELFAMIRDAALGWDGGDPVRQLG